MKMCLFVSVCCGSFWILSSVRDAPLFSDINVLKSLWYLMSSTQVCIIFSEESKQTVYCLLLLNEGVRCAHITSVYSLAWTLAHIRGFKEELDS